MMWRRNNLIVNFKYQMDKGCLGLLKIAWKRNPFNDSESWRSIIEVTSGRIKGFPLDQAARL